MSEDSRKYYKKYQKYKRKCERLEKNYMCGGGHVENAKQANYSREMFNIVPGGLYFDILEIVFSSSHQAINAPNAKFILADVGIKTTSLSVSTITKAHQRVMGKALEMTHFYVKGDMNGSKKLWLQHTQHDKHIIHRMNLEVIELSPDEVFYINDPENILAYTLNFNEDKSSLSETNSFFNLRLNQNVGPEKRGFVCINNKATYKKFTIEEGETYRVSHDVLVAAHIKKGGVFQSLTKGLLRDSGARVGIAFSGSREIVGPADIYIEEKLSKSIDHLNLHRFNATTMVPNTDGTPQETTIQGVMETHDFHHHHQGLFEKLTRSTKLDK